MSNRRIDDHASWVGAAPKGEVFPHGPHKAKMEHSAEGVGELGHYEDTTEDIKRGQDIGKEKVKSNPRKPSYRN